MRDRHFPPALAKLQAAFLSILGRIQDPCRHLLSLREVCQPKRGLHRRNGGTRVALVPGACQEGEGVPGVLLRSSPRMPRKLSSAAGAFAARRGPRTSFPAGPSRSTGFTVGKLIDHETLCDNPITDALIDNTQTPVDEAVAFRLDFPAWMSERSDRDRALLIDMAMGHRTKDLAKRYRMSEGRVSQLRREYHDGWQAFCGEAPC